MMLNKTFLLIALTVTPVISFADDFQRVDLVGMADKTIVLDGGMKIKKSYMANPISKNSGMPLLVSERLVHTINEQIEQIRKNVADRAYKNLVSQCDDLWGVLKISALDMIVGHHYHRETNCRISSLNSNKYYCKAIVEATCEIAH